MADTMTPEQRSRCMSRIRATDTKPEMVVRRWLWSHGYRYRVHVRKLAGSPDIVMRKHRIAIFINGCFWHGHNVVEQPGGELADSACCRIPHSNRPFWLGKISRNRERDLANAARLAREGWRVLTVWECDLRPRRRQATLDDLLARIDSLVRPRPAYLPPPDAAHPLAAEPAAPYGPPP